MKTDDLIKALSADARSIEPPIARTIAIALAGGTLVAAVIFAMTLGVRADFATVIENSWRFDFKFVFTLAVAIPAALLVVGLSRPNGLPSSSLLWLGLSIALLGAASLYEISLAGPQGIHDLVFTQNTGKCIVLIPLLSIAPFVAVMLALKRGAPANPALAGAVGGLLSGALGATLYASFCNSDSPLFVSVWYVSGMLFVAALGGLIGSRLLRW